MKQNVNNANKFNYDSEMGNSLNYMMSMNFDGGVKLNFSTPGSTITSLPYTLTYFIFILIFAFVPMLTLILLIIINFFSFSFSSLFLPSLSFLLSFPFISSLISFSVLSPLLPLIILLLF